MFVHKLALLFLVMFAKVHQKSATSLAVYLTGDNLVPVSIASAGQELLFSQHLDLSVCQMCMLRIVPGKAYEHKLCEEETRLEQQAQDQQFMQKHWESMDDKLLGINPELSAYIKQNRRFNRDDLDAMRNEMFGPAIIDDLEDDYVDTVDTCPDFCEHAACHYDRLYREEFDYVRKFEPMRPRIWSQPLNTRVAKLNSRY